MNKNNLLTKEALINLNENIHFLINCLPFAYLTISMIIKKADITVQDKQKIVLPWEDNSKENLIQYSKFLKIKKKILHLGIL